MDPLKENKHSEPSDGAFPVGHTASDKRPYCKPELTEFGNVVDLTRGGAGSNWEPTLARS